jgi:hypothetical protein
MLHATIFVDGLAYQGEAHETYPANAGGEGWHVANLGELNALHLGAGAPLVIVGMRNL